MAWVNFTGTPSKVFRAFWPYASADSEMVVLFNMQSIPNRRFVWSDSRGRLTPLSAPPRINDSSPHGSYYWDQDTTELWVKVSLCLLSC